MIVVGVDPGSKGAAVVLRDGNIIDWISFTKRSKETQEGQESRITSFFLDLKLIDCQIIWIEKIWGMPGQSSNTTFAQANHYGFLRGVSSALEWDINLVAPVTWQKAMVGHLPKNLTSKEKSVQVALGEFPDFNFLPTKRSKKPDDGLTDAALIALYGWRQNA